MKISKKHKKKLPPKRLICFDKKQTRFSIMTVTPKNFLVFFQLKTLLIYPNFRLILTLVCASKVTF